MFAIDLSADARLGPLEVWHAAEFAAHMDRAREHIRPWVGPAFVTDTLDQARTTLQRYATAAAADRPRLYGIWRHGRLCGGVMFAHFDPATGGCELGCWLEPAAEGNGLVVQACRRLLEWAFDVRGMHRAEWRCRADNTRSSRVAQQLNMTLEGVLRQSWPVEGVHYDTQVWALLADDWQAERTRRAALASDASAGAGHAVSGNPSWARSLSAITLFCDDLAASTAFYRQAFDEKPAYHDDASTVFRIGLTLINLLDVRHAGSLIAPAQPGGPEDRSRVQLTITVSDVDAVCAVLSSRGVQLLNGPCNREWGVRTACFEDPAGHKWEIAQPITTT